MSELFAYVQVIPGFSAEAYAAVAGQLGERAWPGLVVHLAGPCAEGWRIIQVWESEAAFHAFARQRLQAALAQSSAMSRASGPPVFERIIITDAVTAAGPVRHLPGVD